MSKKAKDAETGALADAMVHELGALRSQGDGAYPPRLRQLAARDGGSPTEGQVQAAAVKKTFTTKAVVTEKVGKTSSLDSLVYLKGDEPKPDPAGNLARRFLAVLGSQKGLGAEAYPPTLRRLAELCDNPSNTLVNKATVHEVLTDAAVVTAKPPLDAPVLLREDIQGDIAHLLPELLRFAVAATPKTSTSKGKTTATETTAFTPTEVKGRFVKELQGAIL